MKKVLFILFTTIIVSFFTMPTQAFAKESEEKIELTEENINAVIQFLQETNNGKLEERTIKTTQEFDFVTETAPKDVKEKNDLRNTESDYTIYSDSQSKSFYIEVLGAKITVLTVQVNVDIYIYNDGKVHLYHMGVSVTEHIPCGAEVEISRITNTDGSYAVGEAYVTTGLLPFGEHCIMCFVQCSGVYVEPPALDIAIEQTW